MPEPLSAIASIIKPLGDLFPSALGAVASMRFMPEGLSKRARMFSVFCAWVLGTYFGRALIAYFEVTNAHICDAIMCASALFGLSFAANMVKEMGPMIQAIGARWGVQPPNESEDKKP